MRAGRARRNPRVALRDDRRSNDGVCVTPDSNRSSSPPEPPPERQDTGYAPRWLTLCPFCSGLVRRDLDVPDSPWRCDLHGEVEPVVELYEVPTGEASVVPIAGWPESRRV